MNRVLVLTSHHPSRRRPLQAMYSYYTYQALARYCELRFLSPWPWWSRLRWAGDLARAPSERWGVLNVQYPMYWSVPAAAPVHGVAMAASLGGKVAVVRREFPFDAILTAWAYPDGVAAALIAARERVPLVATVLGSDINELPKRPLLRFQIKRGLARADRIVAVSEALAGEVAKLGVQSDRIVVRHNGVDGERFAIQDRREARAALGLSPAKRLIGYVGRLSREKGIDVLIDAMGALASRDACPIELAIIGAGPLEQALRAQVRASGLDDRVRFLGNIGHDELPRWMSAFDVFCLPSRREGCPNVVLEALAAGRPVVASDVGGIPELLRGRSNGILVPPEDPTRLAEALAMALDGQWDPVALRGTVPSLSWDEVGRAYRDVLDEVIRERAA